MVHRSFYSFESVFLNIRKEKVVKAFLLNTLTLDYDRHKGRVKVFALMIKLGIYRTADVQI